MNVTIGGQGKSSISSNLSSEIYSAEFRLLLDTGSSDLWVKTPQTPLKVLNDSGISTNISYVKGFISGPIQFAEVKLGQYTIPSQGESA